MKVIKISIAACLLVSGIIACKKISAPSSNVSNADAATMLAGSLASSSYGVNNISLDISTSGMTTQSSNLSCSAIKIDTFIRQNPPGSNYIYYYKLIYNHKLNCNTNNLPDNITGTLTYSGNFNTPGIAITNSGTTTYTLAGLTSTATTYSLNGEYKSSGSFKLKSDTTNTGSASVDIVVKNVVISKSTQVIASGSATAIVTGTTTRKGDFTYNGTLVFNGNAMATLTLNGSNYTINLATGVIVAK